MKENTPHVAPSLAPTPASPLPSPPPPPRFCWEGTTFTPKFNFEKWGSEKNDCLDGLKEFLPWIFAKGLTCFLSKKTFKNKIWL